MGKDEEDAQHDAHEGTIEKESFRTVVHVCMFDSFLYVYPNKAYHNGIECTMPQIKAGYKNQRRRFFSMKFLGLLQIRPMITFAGTKIANAIGSTIKININPGERSKCLSAHIFTNIEPPEIIEMVIP
jgi:hypothetical protein